MVFHQSYEKIEKNHTTDTDHDPRLRKPSHGGKGRQRQGRDSGR